MTFEEAYRQSQARAEAFNSERQADGVTAKIVQLSEKRLERTPHRSGKARCLNCKHEWVAAAPIGVTTLECSQCSTFQGVFVGISSTEYSQWQCVCGEYTFFIDIHGPYCCHCGERPNHLTGLPRPA